MASAIVVLLASGLAQGADSVAPCAGVADAKSKSRQFFDGKALMVSLSSLEAQGEAKFHPTFAPPASQCLFEKFDAGASPVEAICSPFEQGEHTLHWRFTTAAPEPREIVVIYDAMASLIAKKDVFFVVEERKGNISYYAIFRDQPTYAALKPDGHRHSRWQRPAAGNGSLAVGREGARDRRLRQQASQVASWSAPARTAPAPRGARERRIGQRGRAPPVPAWSRAARSSPRSRARPWSRWLRQ